LAASSSQCVLRLRASVHAAEESSEETFGREGEFDLGAGAVEGCEAVVGDHFGAGGFLDPGEDLMGNALGHLVDARAEFGLGDAVFGSNAETVASDRLDAENGGGPGGPAFDVGEDLPDGGGAGVDDDALDGLHWDGSPRNEFGPWQRLRPEYGGTVREVPQEQGTGYRVQVTGCFLPHFWGNERGNCLFF
jgi:hypothetical protein